MTWQDILKARRRSLQKVPIAGSPVRGSHGYAGARSRGSKRQQERKEILDPELDESDEEIKWTLHLYTINKHYSDEFDEQEETFTGTFDNATEWAIKRWDNYDAMAEVERLYGGSGFALNDESGKTHLTHEDV